MALDRQKLLKKFLERRHPEYEEYKNHWDFLEETYEGGREWFEENIFRYIKEGEDEFKERVDRAYRFNHTREVVDLVGKYIFKMDVARSDDAPESVRKFWKHATLDRQSVRQLMKVVEKKSSIYGRVWIVIDSTNRESVLTKAEEKQKDIRTYAYVVSPQHALDMSYDENGELNWILIYEEVRDDSDPINSSGDMKKQYRLWTRTASQLFKIEKQGNKVTVVEEPEVIHDLGVVPVVHADNVMSDEPYESPALIADVAYLDRAVANYLSNLDAIIQDQTFSQLAMPAQGLTPGDDAYNKLLEMGTKRIFTYDGEGDIKPFYLSPDVKQAELILKVINKIINEIYHSVGLAGERTKEDNSVGIDNSSGVAKAYDFERVNSLLANKADSLEEVENRVAKIVALYQGEKFDESKRYVMYPDDFDVRGLYDEFEIAALLSLIEAPDLTRKEHMKKVVEKLFPNLKEDLLAKMKREIDSSAWPPKLEMTQPGATGGSGLIKETANNSISNKLVNS